MDSWPATPDGGPAPIRVSGYFQRSRQVFPRFAHSLPRCIMTEKQQDHFDASEQKKEDDSHDDNHRVEEWSSETETWSFSESHTETAPSGERITKGQSVSRSRSRTDK